MKKLLLIVLIFCWAGTYAQQNSTDKMKVLSHLPAALLKMSAPASHNKNIDNGVPLNRHSSTAPVAAGGRSNPSEATIGNTFYDLQTNNSISNRFVNNYDGTMSAVWTYSPDGSTGYPNRGSGYNYFDGTSWQAEPSARIENVRAGFTNIGVTASGKEVVMAHGIQTSGSTLGVLFTSRDAKGTGSWGTNPSILGESPTDSVDYWPKMVTGGPDGLSIHAIWRGGSSSNFVDGQNGPVFYSRSTDDGIGWPVLQSIIPEIDSTYYLGFSADEYSIDAKNNTVAIVASSLGTDVVLVKSTDNGNTWTKTIISTFPIPFFDGSTMSTDTNGDGVPDTLWSGTGDANVAIDNNGEVHVAFTMIRTIGSGTAFSYFPFTSELFYWNETLSSDSEVFIAYAPALNNDTVPSFPADNTSSCPNDPFPWGDYGTVSRVIEMPTLGIDTNNNIYVCYQTTDELSDPSTVSNNNDKLFKHPYIIKSTDGGATWTNYNNAYDALLATQGPVNGELSEGVFASMAKRVDNQVHIIYQRDPFPGESLAAAGTCDQQINSVNSPSDIIYTAIDTALTVGIPQLPSPVYGVLVSANFPNPASDFTKFNVTLNKALNVKVDVEDIMGQNLYSENRGKLSVGTHTITLNTSYLAAGIYFYTVTAGTEKVTGKMIVK